MKKVIISVVILIFFLSSCATKNQKKVHEILSWAINNIEVEDSTVHIPLRHPDYQEELIWRVDNEEVTINNGIINLNGEACTLVLFVGINFLNIYYEQSTIITIDAYDISSVATKFINQFYSPIISRDYNIQTNFTDFSGTNIIWTSSKPEIFSSEGKYNAPFYDEVITINYQVTTTKPQITKNYEKTFTVAKMPQTRRINYLKEKILAHLNFQNVLSNEEQLPTEISELETNLLWYDQYGVEITKLADVNSYIIPHVGLELTVLAITKTDTFSFKYLIQSSESNATYNPRVINSIDLIKELKVGFNIGNTLDAPSEIAWGNPLITKSLLDTIKKAGFNLIRIPITWEGHFINSGEYLINEAYLDRIQEVINYAIDDNTYVIINMHHERWNKTTYENLAKASLIMEKLWQQIGRRFASYDEHLLFEGMNEPRNYDASDTIQWGGNQEAFTVINELNQVFVNTVRSLDGFNKYRHLLITTNGAGTSEAIISNLVVPSDPYVIVSVHSYAPYDFAHDKTSVTTWKITNPAQTNPISSVFNRLNQYFISKNIAVIMGEFACRDKQNLSDRLAWLDYYLNQANQYHIPCIWWDTGQARTVENMTFSILNRLNLQWHFPELVERLVR